MRTLKLFLLVVLFSGIAVLNADAQGKNKPAPTPIGTVAFYYASPTYEFTGEAVLSTVYLKIQIKGTGPVGETGYTYNIGGNMAPVGDGTYAGPVTVEIKSGLICLEKATGTASWVKDAEEVILNITNITNPVCPRR